MDFVARFNLEDEPINVNYELEEPEEIKAILKIDAAPDVSDFATKEELENAVDGLNDRIGTVEEEVAAKVETITGSPLIDVQRTGNAVTLTSKTFVFEQAIASNVWEITHNLNKRPSIQLVDSTGREFEAVKDYINDNEVVITLESATTGFAYLN